MRKAYINNYGDTMLVTESKMARKARRTGLTINHPHGVVGRYFSEKNRRR